MSSQEAARKPVKNNWMKSQIAVMRQNIARNQLADTDSSDSLTSPSSQSAMTTNSTRTSVLPSPIGRSRSSISNTALPSAHSPVAVPKKARTGAVKADLITSRRLPARNRTATTSSSESLGSSMSPVRAPSNAAQMRSNFSNTGISPAAHRVNTLRPTYGAQNGFRVQPPRSQAIPARTSQPAYIFPVARGLGGRAQVFPRFQRLAGSGQVVTPATSATVAGLSGSRIGQSAGLSDGLIGQDVAGMFGQNDMMTTPPTGPPSPPNRYSGRRVHNRNNILPPGVVAAAQQRRQVFEEDSESSDGSELEEDDDERGEISDGVEDSDASSLEDEDVDVTHLGANVRLGQRAINRRHTAMMVPVVPDDGIPRDFSSSSGSDNSNSFESTDSTFKPANVISHISEQSASIISSRSEELASEEEPYGRIVSSNRRPKASVASLDLEQTMLRNRRPQMASAMTSISTASEVSDADLSGSTVEDGIETAGIEGNEQICAEQMEPSLGTFRDSFLMTTTSVSTISPAVAEPKLLKTAASATAGEELVFRPDFSLLVVPFGTSPSISPNPAFDQTETNGNDNENLTTSLVTN